jgi:hypothetical protein
VKTTCRGRHPLWLSAGYGVQALGQVTAKRIHPPLQEVEVKTKVVAEAAILFGYPPDIEFKLWDRKQQKESILL